MEFIVSYLSLLRTVAPGSAGFSSHLVAILNSFSGAENSLQIGSFDRSELRMMTSSPAGSKSAHARATQPENGYNRHQQL